MPIYEYKCENGHVFDVMQKMSDDPVASCVECGASVRKVLQPVGISFKGSGFYSTDYSKKGPKTEAGNGLSGNGDTGSSEKSSNEKSGSSEKSGTAKGDGSSSDKSSGTTPKSSDN